MSINAALARLLNDMASMMELLGQDAFKAAAHARAARAIEDFPGDIGSVARGPTGKADLQKIPGIGAKTAEKIVEFALAGAIGEHAQLSAQVPPGLMELLQVPGLGPKTVRTFWTEARVCSPADLQRIIDDGSILKLPRMGAKSVEKIKAALAIAGEAGKRLRLGQAAIAADAVIAYLKSRVRIERIEAAGSLRRGRETVGDIDLLAVCDEPERLREVFTRMPGVQSVLATGASKSSVRLAVKVDEWADAPPGEGEAGSAGGGDAPLSGATPARPPTGRSVQCDLRVVPAGSWGAALMYFTGSKDFNVAMRSRAQDRGLTLNEYGLFPEDDAQTPPQARGITPLAGATEAEIFYELEVAVVPPELRESAETLDLKESPRLIEVGDIRAELHAHTTASDGTMSIDELIAAARARGFHTIAVTDHSQSSAIAGGLKPDRLREHIAAVHAARARFPDMQVLAGSEVDILPDGSLDYDDELLKRLDIVVASPHAALKQDPAIATARLVRAIRHPLVHILGHPTGRQVLRRTGLEPDMAQIVAAAREADTALEINAHWMRLDLRDVHVRQAALAGVRIAINCDVHYPADFDNLRFGVMTGRRGWLTPSQCVNTLSAQDLGAWLKRKRR